MTVRVIDRPNDVADQLREQATKAEQPGDAHTGLAHAIHVPGATFLASALSSFGADPAGALRAMI